MNSRGALDPRAVWEGYVAERQLAALDRVLSEVLPDNVFQRARLGKHRRCQSLDAFLELPFLDKQTLVADALEHPPFGRNLTYAPARYVRYHQTSGTTGTPLPILDTAESWAWWERCWEAVYEAGGVTAEDRLFFAFSFGPFIGFWAAYDGARSSGALRIPGGGASSVQRLQMMATTRATVLLATPTYALHLAEVGAREGIDTAGLPVRLVIVAGEPGGSIPATRDCIARAWGAEVLDHAGATEVGAWGVGCERGLCVNEREFIAEVIDRETGNPIEPGSGRTGELVLTSLDRGGWPVIRYRTGDVVRPLRGPGPFGSSSLVLEDGVLGRADDMVTVRGMNVFPSALEDVIRAVVGTAEYRITATRRGVMDELCVEVEGDDELARRIAGELRRRIGIRVEVRALPDGALPRWEAKARRFVKAAS